MNLDLFRDQEKVKTVDAFIYRFIKLQDYMGDKLFRQILIATGDYRDNMALVDLVDRLEKLDLIDDADQWMKFRILRNKLTHEYPDNEAEILEGIKLAVEAFKAMGNVLGRLTVYAEEKGFL